MNQIAANDLFINEKARALDGMKAAPERYLRSLAHCSAL